MMHRLEELNEEWAAQLATYGWTMGEKPGSEFLTQIDQLACKPNGTDKPEIRVATHRTRIGEAFQLETLANYQKLWTAIQTGYIFTDMTREDSDAKCRVMDKRGTNYAGVVGGSKEDWLNQTTRPL